MADPIDKEVGKTKYVPHSSQCLASASTNAPASPDTGVRTERRMDDEEKRRASIAELTANVEGE
jgi:hypothetical protein